MNIFHFLLIGMVVLSFILTTGLLERNKKSNGFQILSTGLICSIVIAIIILSAYYGTSR